VTSRWPSTAVVTPDRPEERGGDVDVRNLVLDVVEKRRSGLDTRLDQALADGTIDQTIAGAPALTLSVLDPDDELMLSPLFDSRIDVVLDGVPFRLTKVGRQDDDTLALTFEHRLVAWMREHTKTRKVSRGKMTRAEFAKLLVGEIHAGPVRFVSPEVHVKQPIGKLEGAALRKQTRRERDTVRAPGFADGTNLKSKGQTLNSRQVDRLERALSVADRINAKANARVAMVCAMIGESNIGEGTGSRGTTFQTTAIPESDLEAQALHFLRGGRSFLTGGAIGYIRAHAGASPGEVASAVEISDKGGSYYDAFASEARKIVSAYGGSDSSDVSRQYTKRYEFTRGSVDQVEDTWTALGRLADEVHWRRFVVGQRTIYFIADDTLMRSRPRYLIEPQSVGLLGKPTFEIEVGRRTVIKKGKRVPLVSECTINARLDRWDAPPGTVIELDGWGAILDGKWLVSSIRRPIFDAAGAITLTQPQNRLPEPRSDTTTVSKAGGGSGSSAALSGSASAKFVEAGKQISERNLPYVWGGGHARVGVADGGTGRDPGTGFDCSGYISACAAAAGMWPDGLKTGQVSGWFASSWGEAGEGEHITVYANGGHVFAKVTIEGERVKWVDTSRQAGGPAGPHVRYGDRSTAGFTARHWPGT
jgi:hypothetical protein